MRAQFHLIAPDIATIAGLSHQILLPDHSLNAIFGAQSFHCFAHADSLQELHRRLKPQAYLVFI